MDTTQATETVETPQQEVIQETQPTEVVENIQTELVAEPVVETPKPFELPIEKPKNPLEGLTPEQVAQHFDKQALLKAFGYDDFALGALDYYSKTGSLAEYAEVKSVDYNKMPDEKIVERKLREQYASANLSEDELNLLVEDEMNSRFKLDADAYTEREVQISKARLKAEATEFRKTLIDRQSKFMAPERQPVQAEPEVSYEQQMEIQRAEVLKDAGIQQFLQAKKLQMGDAQSPYNFEVQNPQDTLAILYDTNRYLYHVAKKNQQGQVMMQDGKPVLDYQKMLKVAAYVENMDAIERNLISYGKTLGEKKVIDEAENVGLNRSQGTQGEPDDVYKALARKLAQ